LTHKEDTTVGKARSGDADATRALVERYQRPLVSFLYGLTGDEVTTEDLAQETFLRALSSLENFKPGGSFLSWLFGIAHHVHVDHLRKRKERPVQSLVEGEAVGRIGQNVRVRRLDEDDELEETEDRIRTLRLALEQLNPEHRAVLSARYLQDLRRNEIAQMLGISEHNVKMRLYRAKKELVDRFERISRNADWSGREIA
jgi:RNA polymerase sigma-70 factor (ECF subfamily)